MTEQRREHWWYRPGFVTLLTALVGAMVPLAAGVQAWVQKNREIQLENEKNKQSIRLHYLDILVSSSLKDVEMFLGFIAETDDNPELRKWAQLQRNNVKDRIAKLEAERDDAEKRAAEAQKALAAAKASAEKKLREAQAQANANQAQKEKAEEEARKAQAALVEAQRQADARQAEALDLRRRKL